jgi:ABC-type multidrug transport system fused ATPase/permease subunit
MTSIRCWFISQVFAVRLIGTTLDAHRKKDNVCLTDVLNAAVPLNEHARERLLIWHRLVWVIFLGYFVVACVVLFGFTGRLPPYFFPFIMVAWVLFLLSILTCLLALITTAEVHKARKEAFLNHLRDDQTWNGDYNNPDLVLNAMEHYQGVVDSLKATSGVFSCLLALWAVLTALIAFILGICILFATNLQHAPGRSSLAIITWWIQLVVYVIVPFAVLASYNHRLDIDRDLHHSEPADFQNYNGRLLKYIKLNRLQW